MVVEVCDMIMGSGKTSAAISKINHDTKGHYIFITPYLEEVKRIEESCASRKFHAPSSIQGGKLKSLHSLLKSNLNIASTHALFRTYNGETISLIKKGKYTLILDEVADVVEVIKISPDDLRMLLNDKMIRISEGGRVSWLNDEYIGKFESLRDTILTGNVILYNGCFMLWEFPIEIFESFEEVIILTYLFDAQIQKYYFDMNHVNIRKTGVICENGEYHFCTQVKQPDFITKLHEKIHILDDKKLNAVGEQWNSLSCSWYERAKRAKGRPKLKQLNKNLGNLFKHKFVSTASQRLWTTFQDYKSDLSGRGYTGGFLSFNARATNAYRDRDHLAYCVNVFYNPVLKNYFLDHGVAVHENEYALSEMIQWIWRSAIRDGKDIWIYIPSRRMRSLLQSWLESLRTEYQDSTGGQ